MDSSLRLASPESEGLVLAALMLSSVSVDQVVETLAAEDFSDQRHRKIMNAIVVLERGHGAVDPIAVGEYLSNHCRDDIEFGGLAYIGALVSTAVVANIMAHVRNIHDLAQLRRLVFAMRQAQAGLSNDLPPAVQAEKAADMILSAISEVSDDEPKLLSEVSEEWLSQLQKVYEAGETVTGLSTGFQDLDQATNGLHAGELIIIGARPAMGKSVLAMNIAMNAGRAGHAVYYLSLEMAAPELMSRMASAQGSHEYSQVQSADFDAIGSALVDFKSSLVGLRVVIDERASMTVQRLRSQLKRFKRRAGGLDLVVVDYLQLLSLANDKKNLYEQVSVISRELKVLATELRVPIICLAQLSRGLETRTNKRPILSDLRDSGSLEQDANVVIFLYREAQYHQECSYPKIAELNIAKIRHGETKVIPLIAELEYQRFVTPKADCLPSDWKHQGVISSALPNNGKPKIYGAI